MGGEKRVQAQKSGGKKPKPDQAKSLSIKIHCAHDALVKIKDLKPHPKNRNKHPSDQIARLAEIIEYQGIRAPIKVSRRSGFITAGHGRLAALKRLKMKEVPVNYQDYATDEQEYADLQSDNAIASWSELDLTGIVEDVGEFGSGFDINLLGIKGFEISARDPGCDEDEVPDVKEPFVKSGEIWQLGNHRLMCGDATAAPAVETLMDGNLGDLLVSDPPYGVGYIEKNAAVHGGIVKNNIGKKITNDTGSTEEMAQLWGHLFSHADHFTDESSYYVFSPQGGELMMMMMMMMIHKSKWQLKHSLIWCKQNFVFGRCDYHYQHEPVLYGWKKRGKHNWYADRSQSSLLKFDKPHKSDLHPTTKPIDLLEYLIGNSSKASDLVVDLFGGSGSTLIACEKTKRKCFMMEIDPHYCSVIIERWQKYTGKKAKRINGKKARV